jgi:hypothetical protein
VHSIDDLNVIEIDVLLGKSHLSLGRRLDETLASMATALTIAATVSLETVLALVIAPRSACDGTAPNNVKTIVENRDADVLLLAT